MDYFYSAAAHRLRGALWPSFAPARIGCREYVRAGDSRDAQRHIQFYCSNQVNLSYDKSPGCYRQTPMSPGTLITLSQTPYLLEFGRPRIEHFAELSNSRPNSEVPLLSVRPEKRVTQREIRYLERDSPVED